MHKLTLRTKKLFLILFFTIFAALIFPGLSYAATLSFTPQSETVLLNTTFTVTIDLDTEGELTTATDAVFTYNPTLLEVRAIDFPQPLLYPVNAKVIDNTAGTVRITSAQQDAVNSYTGVSVLATITFFAKGVGIANVPFTCTLGQTNDSNVFKKGTSQDILECGNLINGVYTISQSGQPINTPTPTPKKAIPAPGTFGPTVGLIIAGAVILGIGALLVL